MFEKALDLIPVEEGENEEDSDSENPLSSGNYIIFYLLYFRTLFTNFFRPQSLEPSPQLNLSPVLPSSQRRKPFTSQAPGSKSTSSSSSSDLEPSVYPSSTRFGSTNRHTPSTPPMPYAKSRSLPHRPSPHMTKNTQTKEKNPARNTILFNTDYY